MMGGTLYVNVLYSIVTSKTLDYNDKELAMITCAIFDDFGILSASILSLILDNTVFSEFHIDSENQIFGHIMFRASH